MLGPAFVASIAYVDPGNVATNLQAGARYGYLLLWVVLAANLIATLIQYLSAKLGIVTDQNLPEAIRARWPRALVWGMWLAAEVMAMSTDIAAFLGAALGLNLLFNVSLFPAGIITGAIAFAILDLQTRVRPPPMSATRFPRPVRSSTRAGSRTSTCTRRPRFTSRTRTARRCCSSARPRTKPCRRR